METDMMKWIKDCCKQGFAVTGAVVQSQARRIADSPIFKASAGWSRSFKVSHCLSTRQGTSIGQKLPSRYKDKICHQSKATTLLHTGKYLQHVRDTS